MSGIAEVAARQLSEAERILAAGTPAHEACNRRGRLLCESEAPRAPAHSDHRAAFEPGGYGIGSVCRSAIRSWIATALTGIASGVRRCLQPRPPLDPQGSTPTRAINHGE